jgi:hypothetical protein
LRQAKNAIGVPMLTNKNVFIYSLSLYVIFISFVNAQEKHRIEISSQKCEKWLSTKNSAKIFFTAKNLTKINYTNLMYQVAIKDNDGNIVDKTYLKFGRLKPSGEAFGDIATSGATCEEIRSVQVLSTALVSIDGDTVNEKISHLIADNTFLKFGNNKSNKQASEEEKNDKKFSDATATISKLNGEWYSYKWKYGYTLKDGKGYATVVNSPNFKEGQEIVRLAALSDTSFFGENVYKDGKFYKVKVTLKPDGKLYFEGEKNAKWEMERISGKDFKNIKNQEKNHNQVTDGGRDPEGGASKSSADEKVGICFGHLMGAKIYKVPAKDWDHAAVINFKRNNDKFQRVGKQFYNCRQDQLENTELCLSKIEIDSDRNFMSGVVKGLSVADYAFSKGGVDNLKINLSIICVGLD